MYLQVRSQMLRVCWSPPRSQKADYLLGRRFPRHERVSDMSLPAHVLHARFVVRSNGKKVVGVRE